jgi:hypothetical protein
MKSKKHVLTVGGAILSCVYACKKHEFRFDQMVVISIFAIVFAF